MSKKLRGIDVEEAKRKVSGLSGTRRCMFLSEFSDQLVVENRFADKKGGERLIAALQEDGINVDQPEYALETLNR
jgi:hypothetical protein